MVERESDVLPMIPSGKSYREVVFDARRRGLQETWLGRSAAAPLRLVLRDCSDQDSDAARPDRRRPCAQAR